MPITDFDSAFWSDPWLRKRSPHARYLFSYLFTSSHKNRAGAYPIGLDMIVFETGMSIDKVRPALKELEPKVLYDYDLEIVFVTNHVRHQYTKKNRIAPTISLSIVADLRKLPEDHDFIHIFMDKYNEFFGLEGTVPIEYGYSVGKGKEGDLKYNESFEKFWKAYPSRNGKKYGKPNAYKNFLNFKEEQWPQLIECANNYSKSQKARSNFAKDPERFLKNGYWQDWKEPEEIPEIKDDADNERTRADIQNAKNELRTLEDNNGFYEENPKHEGAKPHWAKVKSLREQIRKLQEG